MTTPQYEAAVLLTKGHFQINHGKTQMWWNVAQDQGARFDTFWGKAGRPAMGIRRGLTPEQVIKLAALKEKAGYVQVFHFGEDADRYTGFNFMDELRNL